jgi:hypothetical protein
MNVAGTGEKTFSETSLPDRARNSSRFSALATALRSSGLSNGGRVVLK